MKSQIFERLLPSSWFITEMRNFLSLLSAAIAFAVCHLVGAVRASDDPAKSEAAALSAEQNKPTSPALNIGMSADEVRAIVGKPVKVKPVKQDGVNAEIWVYTYEKAMGTKQVQTGMREVPVLDMRSGTYKMAREPVYGLQTTYWVETTELLMIDGALANSKRYRSSKRNYTR